MEHRSTEPGPAHAHAVEIVHAAGSTEKSIEKVTSGD